MPPAGGHAASEPEADLRGNRNPSEPARHPDLEIRLARAVLASPRFFRLMGSILPDLLDGLAGKGRLRKALARFAGGTLQAGCVARAAQTERQPEKPLLKDKLTDLLEATDFGELAEAAAGSRKRFLPLWEEALETLWSYPSKVVCLLSVFPHLAGFTMEAAARGLAPFNRLPPDMLVDVVVALIGDMDGSTVSGLVNQGAEVARKIQVGSTLIGSPGRPELPEAVDRLMEAILDGVDLEALAAAGKKMAALTETMAEKRADRLERYPEWNAARLEADLGALSRKARDFSRKTRRWEAIPSDERLARIAAEGLSDMDAGELADTCNRCLDLAGRLMETRPEFVPNLVRSFAEAIDVDAIAHCLALASSGSGAGAGAADPAAALLHRLADQVEANPDSELAGALERLGGLLFRKKERS